MIRSEPTANPELEDRTYEISDAPAGSRLDLFLASCPLAISRSRLQALIRDGNVKVNGRPAKASYRLKAADRVVVSVPAPVRAHLKPEEVRFTTLYEDDALLVIDKPAGLVVHPAPGHSSGTLVHGLLHAVPDLSGIGGTLRPGIVHRLDKNTSGALVIAKHDGAHAALSAQFKSGAVRKEYLALVHGHMKTDRGRVEQPIARHPVRRRFIYG